MREKSLQTNLEVWVSVAQDESTSALVESSLVLSLQTISYTSSPSLLLLSSSLVHTATNQQQKDKAFSPIPPHPSFVAVVCLLPFAVERKEEEKQLVSPFVVPSSLDWLSFVFR